MERVSMRIPEFITQVHCSYSGWLPPVFNNIPCGEIGRKYVIQGFKCGTSDNNISVCCQGWHKDTGWQDVAKNGDLCGTVGKSLPLLGFRIYLEGSGYSVAYRVFLDDGWSNWCRDGEEIITDSGFYAMQVQLLVQNEQPDDSNICHLDELGQRYQTDKASYGHDYLNFYEEQFGCYKNDSFILAEVGIFNGASIRMWEDFFPNASIVAFDITPKKNEYKRTSIICGDASDSFLILEALYWRRPLIFIEDGSHRYSHQISTFESAFSLLRPGGFYVCEDIQTSFGECRGKYFNDQELDAITYFSKLSYLAANSSLPFHPYLENVPTRLITISRYVDYMIFRKHCVLIRKKLHI